MKTLKLTSPHIKSADVKELQAALKRRAFYDGKVGGVYDVPTAQAVYRAKYWLGYPTPDHSASQLLLDYLNKVRSPNVLMKTLAKKRLTAKTKTKAIRLRALDNAKNHLGNKEMPAGTNKVPWASEWYGVIGPWCAMAVTRWYVDAGSKVFKRGKCYSYVPIIVADAHAGRNNLSVTLNPMPGDLVCYDWDKDKVADHIGLFEEWTSRANGSFSAIEGNTAVGNDSNGGEVMRRTRVTQNVLAFVHVGK